VIGSCARGAAGAERGGGSCGWPAPSPGRSIRGNLAAWEEIEAEVERM